MDTCFKLITDVPIRTDFRHKLQQFGQLQQVFVPNFQSTVMYVKYKDASSAQEAKKALLIHPRINEIEDIEDWNVDSFSTPKELSPELSPMSDDEDNDSLPETNKTDETMSDDTLSDGISMHFRQQHSLLGPAPSACLYCYNPTPMYECYRCRNGYCNEKCRDADWEKHVDECKPFLIVKPRRPIADPVDSD